MNHYSYQALDPDQRRVDGELQAENLQDAIRQLERNGLNVLSIGSAQGWPAQTTVESTIGTGTAADEISDEQALLRYHMPPILERSRAIAPALRAFAEELPAGRNRRQLNQVVDVLEHGDADEATSALQSHPEVWIPLFGAVTSSRDPAHVLREFVDESQQASELRRQRRLTLAYPLLIGGVALIVLVAMSYFVIPIFREIFYEFELDLPYLTRIVIEVADWIASGKVFIAAALIGVAGLAVWLATRVFPAFGNGLSNRWNLPIGRSIAIARMARFTADLLEAGIDLPDSIRIAAFASQRGGLRRGALQVARGLGQSSDLPRIDSWHPLTATVGYTLQTDLPPAARVRLLREISQAYADRARMRLSWTRGIVEPITIGVVGVFVGVIVLALFLPLMKLIEGLSM